MSTDTERDLQARLAEAQSGRVRADSRYQQLFRTSPQAIFELDRHGRLVAVNPAGEELLGVSAGDLLGTPFSQLVRPEDRADAEAELESVLSGTIPTASGELVVVRPGGETRIVRSTAVPLVDADGIAGAQCVVRDLTDVRRTRNRKRLLTSALECLSDGVALVDRSGKYLFTNAAHAHLFGYPVGMPPAEGVMAVVANESEREMVRESLANPVPYAHWTGRIECRRVDSGELVPIDLTRGSTEVDGAIVTFSILQDARPKIAEEARVRQMEQLAEVGKLVGGVAHELNNPLHAIRNLATLLLMSERPELERDDLEVICREADRMAQIVTDLRRVGRDSDSPMLDKVAIDLNEVIEHVLRTRAYPLKCSGIEVRKDLASILPSVLGNRGQIEQVVLNLLVNAEQALATAEGERRIIVRTRPSPKGAVLHVVDNGPGISPADMLHIFDPFYTTKSAEEGTGLGLALVQAILTDHGAEIKVDSELGNGAAFRVEFPGTSGPTSTTCRTELRPTVPSRRVLIVDDEEPVRRSIVRFLRSRGHQVDEVGDGESALRCCAEADYDVILTDLVMPGLSGRELMEGLRESGVADRVIFMTGDGANRKGIGLLAAVGATVLLKPVILSEIASAVEDGTFISS